MVTRTFFTCVVPLPLQTKELGEEEVVVERVRELRTILEGLGVKEGKLVIVEPPRFRKVRKLAEMELGGVRLLSCCLASNRIST